jgi:hypothetical protein
MKQKNNRNDVKRKSVRHASMRRTIAVFLPKSQTTLACLRIRYGLIPPTKVVHRYLYGRNADIVRKMIRALPLREQRNYIIYCQSPTRLPGRHVENYRLLKRF